MPPAFAAPPADAGPFQPFWEAVGRGEIALPRCDGCGTWLWYPPERCPECGDPRRTWVALPGSGTLFTYTVVHRAFAPGVRLAEPYVTGLVELDGAPGRRLVAIVAGCAPDEVKIGMRLRASFERVDGRTLPVFVPAADAR